MHLYIYVYIYLCILHSVFSVLYACTFNTILENVYLLLKKYAEKYTMPILQRLSLNDTSIISIHMQHIYIDP